MLNSSACKRNDEKDLCSTRGNSTDQNSANSKNHSTATLFPFRLFEMLDECERNQKTHVVSWLPDGRAFKVHRVPEFVETILPQHFRQSKYKSYQRQLNLWGFERITSNGPEKGAYFHRDFVKGDRSRIKTLTRQQGNKTTTGKSVSNSQQSATVHSKKRCRKPVDKLSSKKERKAIKERSPTQNGREQSVSSTCQHTLVVTPPLSPTDHVLKETVVPSMDLQQTPNDGSTNHPTLCEKDDDLADILYETGFLSPPTPSILESSQNSKTGLSEIESEANPTTILYLPEFELSAGISID